MARESMRLACSSLMNASAFGSQRSLRCSCMAMSDCWHIVSACTAAVIGEIGCARLRMASRKFCLWSSENRTRFSFGSDDRRRQRLGLGAHALTADPDPSLRPGDQAGHAAELELLGARLGRDEIHVDHRWRRSAYFCSTVHEYGTSRMSS